MARTLPTTWPSTHLPTTSATHGERIYGLDVLRAVAVICVMIGHFLAQSRTPPYIRKMGNFGMLGVEIFFVLSGFLIGGILLDLLDRGKFNTRRDLVHFWARRWLRTLPNYYLYFLIYLAVEPMGILKSGGWWLYLGFLQNFFWRSTNFFILSWSLAIEEYFYLLFPLFLLAAIRLTRRNERALLISIGTFLVFPFILKVIRCPFYNDWQSFDLDVRITTLTRLDALMYGVSAVAIKKYHPELWRRLKSWVPLAAASSVGVFVYFYLNMPGVFTSYTLQVLLLPFISLSFAGLLPYFAEWRTTKRGFLQRFFIETSKTSYSIYLCHVLVLGLVNQALKLSPTLWDYIYPRFWLLYPIDIALVIFVSRVSYEFWEQPFMRLRRRIPG